MPRARSVEKHEARRAQILRAAEALFVERGFHQTGMAAICAAVGMSPGALYRYFTSKTEIIRALVEEERAEAHAAFGNVAAAEDPKAALAEALVAVLPAVNERSYARLALEIAAEGARDPVAGAILSEAEADLRGRLAVALVAASGGRLSARAAQDGALMLTMLLQGATGVSGALPGKARMRTLIARTIDALTEAAP